jgi:hypothetical protein
MRRLNPHRDYLQIMSSVYIFWNVKGKFPICLLLADWSIIVCLGCHNLHLHYKRLSNLPFFVSREYKNTLFYFKCEIKNKQPFENM